MRQPLGRAPLAAAMLVVAALPAAAGPVGRQTVACINRDSGYTWPVSIDYRSHTADSFPAEISEDWVSWHDTAHGGYYDFDRRTGDLTARFASSTGGYSLQYSCRTSPGR